MFSRIFYQLFSIEFIFLILITPYLFSGQLVYTNHKISGKVYDSFDELKSSVFGSEQGFIGVFVRPDDVVRDVSFLCLGSTSKAFLAENLGFLMGVQLKKYGVEFCISGFPLTLSPSKIVAGLRPKDFISSSPYIVAQILESYYMGLIRSGIFPVIDASKGFNESVIFSLKTKDVYLPVLITEKQFRDFKKLGYEVPTLIKRENGIFWGSSVDISKYLHLGWFEEVENLDSKIQKLREDLIKSSIVLVKRGKFNKIKVISSIEDLEEDISADTGVVLINNPYLIDSKRVNGLVVVFSSNDAIISEAIKVLKGLSAPTGKITWLF